MRPNPLLPRTQSDETEFPIEFLKVALVGRGDPSRITVAEVRKFQQDGKEVMLNQETAAKVIASEWSKGLPDKKDRTDVSLFYKGVLKSFLTGKSAHTKRSWSGTICDFFDFVAHRRDSVYHAGLRLVAPHELEQDDVDGYVASIAHVRDPSPEMILDPMEKMVAEWMYDVYSKAPTRELSEIEVEAGLQAEFPRWDYEPGALTSSPTKTDIDFVDESKASSPYKGFIGKGQPIIRTVLSSLVRKKVLVRSPTAKEATKGSKGPERKKYPYGKARYTKPASTKSATVSTQIQRLTALANFWASFMSESSLDFNQASRPSILRVNPWIKPRKVLFKGVSKTNDEQKRSLRRMTVEELGFLLQRLHKRYTPRKANVGIFNILAKRDELAILFLTSTGLRVFEALQAKVENMKPDEKGALWHLDGIRRKMGVDQVTVVVPNLIMERLAELRELIQGYVARVGAMFAEEWDKMRAEVLAEQPGLDEEDQAIEADKRMAPFAREHTKEHFFLGQLRAYLKMGMSGPLLPALGRWGNALTKARTVLKTDERVPAVVVPWDENSIRDRLLLMAAKGSPLRNRLHPHAFRHLSVAMAEAFTPGAEAARLMAGHKDGRTTEIYRDTVSLRRTATLAIEAELRLMLLKSAGQEPKKAPPVAPPGVVPPAAVPPAAPSSGPQPPPVEVLSQEGKIIKLRGSRLAFPMTKDDIRKQAVAADLVSQVAAPPPAEVHAVAEKSVVSSPETPPPPATHPPETAPVVTPPAAAPKPGLPRPGKIHAVGGGLVPPAISAPSGQKKPPSPPEAAKQPKLKNPSEYVWSTPPDEWFLLANHAWANPIPLSNSDLLTNVFKKGYLPGPHVVSQWGLARQLLDAMVWTGVRTLLPYRIAIKDAKTTVKWTMESIGAVEAPGTPSRFLKNPNDDSIPFTSLAIPVVNFDDTKYVATRLAPELRTAYEGVKKHDPGASRAFGAWLIDIVSHFQWMMHKVKESDARLSKQGKGAVNLEWLGQDSSISQEMEDNQAWGKIDFVESIRGSWLRDHDPREVSQFILAQGAAWHGPVGVPSDTSDWRKRSDANAERLQNALDGIQRILFQKTEGVRGRGGKIAITQAPQGLRKYELPRWVTETDDPLGDEQRPDLGVSSEDLPKLKEWILANKGFKDTVSFEQDASSPNPNTSPDPYWNLVSRFAHSPTDKTIHCPAEYDSARIAYTAKNMVDPIVACRRAVRHLWEVSRALQEPMNKKDVDQIWGVIWSWVMPSVGVTKRYLAYAFEQAGQSPDLVDSDSVIQLLELWSDAETVKSAVFDSGHHIRQVYERLVSVYLDRTTREVEKARLADSEANVGGMTPWEASSYASRARTQDVSWLRNAMKQAAAKSVVVIWENLGGDSASVAMELQKAFDEFEKSYNMGEGDMDEIFDEDFNKRMDDLLEEVTHPIAKSAWDPEVAYHGDVLKVRVKHLKEVGLPESMAEFDYEGYLDGVARYRASCMGFASMGIFSFQTKSSLMALAASVAAQVKVTKKSTKQGTAMAVGSKSGTEIRLPGGLAMTREDAVAVAAAPDQAMAQQMAEAGIQVGEDSVDFEAMARQRSERDAEKKSEEKKSAALTKSQTKPGPAFWKKVDEELTRLSVEKAKTSRVFKSSLEFILKQYGGNQKKRIVEMSKLLGRADQDDEDDSVLALESKAFVPKEAAKPTSVASFTDEDVRRHEAAVADIMAYTLKNSQMQHSTAVKQYGRLVADKAPRPGVNQTPAERQSYFDALLKFIISYNPDYTPNRPQPRPLVPRPGRSPGLAHRVPGLLARRGEEDPASLILRRIRINPINLILALYTKPKPRSER